MNAREAMFSLGVILSIGLFLLNKTTSFIDYIGVTICGTVILLYAAGFCVGDLECQKS